MQNLKELIQPFFGAEFSCEVLNHLGIDADTRKNFKIRDENNASASIRNDGYISDFGGDFKGNIIDYVMYHFEIDFPKALEFLADYLGIQKTANNYTPTIRTPTPKSEKDNKPSYNLDFIKRKNKEGLTPANALLGVRELYPFVKSINDLTYSILGYSGYYNSLTIEFPTVTTVRQSHHTKWQTFGAKSFIPKKIYEDDEVVFFFSGMGENIAFLEMGLSYIGIQADSIRFDDIQTDKTIIVLEENDDSSRKLTQRIINHFQNVKVLDIAKFANKKDIKGYDLRDLANDLGSFDILKMMLLGATNMLQLIEKPIQDETIIPYRGDYIPKITIKSGVIIARTGTGKTYNFENKANTLILVPRVLQTTVFSGDNGDYLLSKILTDGAIITYDKFYGHYRHNDEFRNFIDKGKIKVVVDEAHTLVAYPSKKHKLIYGLDAIFMSGTLEKFFREDLQRYKYKPEAPENIFYTNGYLPKIKGSLVFVDSAKALMFNYSKNCIVSKEHKFESVDIHKTTKDVVFATSCLREGISVHNPNFTACMVFSQACKMWSTKDIIQGLHRVRIKNSTMVVSSPPKEAYIKKVSLNWWTEFINKQTDERIINTILGEFYSTLIKTTHKTNKYENADEYGIVCYLANKTKDNYDKDFYRFIEYKEDNKPLIINLDTKGLVEEDNGEMMSYSFENGDTYKFPCKKQKAFLKWAENVNSGFVDKLMKLDKPRNFGDVYRLGGASRTVRENYNKTYKKQGKKYSIDMFFKLIKDLVQIEIYDKNGKKIERIGSQTSLKNISIKVVGFCPILEAEKVGLLPPE